MIKVQIFNIQKFSIHDGPGIRTTVFLKGCPLNCMWCHNPESINKNIDILYDKEKCTLCGECIKKCKRGALKIIDEAVITDLSKCMFCGECAFYCINNARELVGKEYTIDELIQEVKKDMSFYEESGGGVTLSGGEPLLQIEAVLKILKKLKNIGIHTAIDTSGYIPFENMLKIIDYTDVFLYDLKIIGDDKHKKYIGVSNALILDNLKKLSNLDANINLRMPIIEGINADLEDITKAIEFIKQVKIKDINILPYHDIAKHKYKKLGRNYREDIMKVPTDKKIQIIKNMFEKEGYNVKIGG